jgi:phage shock protein E
MNPKLVRAALIALPVAIFAIWTAAKNTHSPERIASTEAQRLVQRGALLVDVRTQSEFQAHHLPNAVNVPVQELSSRLKELEPKDRPIVLYCRSGHRSGIARSQLQAAGFPKVYDLGPMSAW